MTRHAFALAAAIAVALVAPSASFAFFPPTIGITKQPVPPDPFKPPTTGGLGEPDAPPPPPGPTVQTPEPASMVLLGSGLLGVASQLRRQRAKAQI